MTDEDLAKQFIESQFLIDNLQIEKHMTDAFLAGLTHGRSHVLGTSERPEFKRAVEKKQRARGGREMTDRHFCGDCGGYVEPLIWPGVYPCDCKEETYTARIKELEERLNKAEMLIEALLNHTEFKQ